MPTLLTGPEIDAALTGLDGWTALDRVAPLRRPGRLYDGDLGVDSVAAAAET